MSDLEKALEGHSSAASLDNASTLGNDTKAENARNKEQGEEVIIDPEKRVQKSTGRDSQASYIQDVEAQAPRLTQDHPPAAASQGPLIVPRHQRRGWFARLVLIPEVEEPKNYGSFTKWLITFIIAIAGIAAPFGSSIIFPSLEDIARSFGTTAATTNFSVGLYMLALAIFPLFWSSFCESLGRRPIYLISFTLFVVFNILSALSVNISMFVVMRLLSGGAAGSAQSVGAGTLADIWHTRERGRAMGFFYLGPLMGPLLSPIVGGALQLRWGWRSTMWFLTIYAFFTLNLLFWCLPETLKVTKSVRHEIMEEENVITDGRPQLARTTTTQSVKVQGKIWIKVLKRFFIDPLSVIKYLRFPAVAITVYYASITFGSLYTLQVSVQVTFSQPPYNFSALQIGLSYLANSLGYLSASVAGGRWADKIMTRKAEKLNRRDANGELIYLPEDRMGKNAWIAAFMYPAALVWYGWTAEKQLFYVVPLIANYFFGVSSMLVFSMATTMLTEFMPKKASTGVALNNLCRNICSFIGAVVAEPLISAIGDGWLFTGIGVISLASSSIIWAMKHYGPRWRANMDGKID